VRLGKHAEAAAAVGELTPQFETLSVTCQHHLQLAAGLARCQALAAADPALGDADRRARAEAYGAQAVALLSGARERGWKDLTALGVETQALLADRADYRRLVKGLQAARSP
jgi:hypothetical protein